jgi:hypothetical protein
MHTSNHVLEQLLVGMPAFQLRLPAVVMGIHKTGADNFVRTIDNLGSIWRVDICRNLNYLVVLDQKAASGWCNVIVIIVYKECAILEKNNAVLWHNWRRRLVQAIRCSRLGFCMKL